jgi:LytS/YehU family sensor histidine kinase
MDAIMVLNLIGAFRRRHSLPKRRRIAFFSYLLPLATAMFIHTFTINFPLVYAGLNLFALSMFVIVVGDQAEQYLIQQREIAHQRASILVLQMRPHFIYNTMTSIYYLCEQDSKKAQQVTMDFTTYLRKNFTAIASVDTIAFPDELEHTQAYLAVEQAQFEDRLLVDYDTPHVRFRVPPLTLQPIVENAVKHGMDPDGEPLRICIRTRETGAGSQVVVEDNGTGFAPAGDGDPHVGLANIEQRLEMMCGGRLSVEPREGGGTVVTVTIPE